jgi:hypothetical protein
MPQQRWQVLGALLAAVLGAVALYLLLTWLLHLPLRPVEENVEQQKLLADMVKIALGLAAGVGAAVALIVAYRRARVEESASHRDDQRLFSSRYQDAADLLGHDKAAVRFAGIYAMARLADDWEEQRQQCIDVLCAYLRIPYDPQKSEPGEREVRFAVIKLIRNHLRPGAQTSWRGHNLDFTGAVFDGGDFSRAEFSGSYVNFGGAVFAGGLVDFRRAVFSGGTVYFARAEFSGARVDFSRAEFSGGTVNLRDAKFSDGTVHFSDAVFSGGAVNFNVAVFSGGAVDFGGAKFSGGIVDFDHADFSGAEVDLSEAQLALNGAGPRNLPAGPVPGLKVPSNWHTQAHPAGPSAQEGL